MLHRTVSGRGGVGAQLAAGNAQPQRCAGPPLQGAGRGAVEHGHRLFRVTPGVLQITVGEVNRAQVVERVSEVHLRPGLAVDVGRTLVLAKRPVCAAALFVQACLGHPQIADDLGVGPEHGASNGHRAVDHFDCFGQPGGLGGQDVGEVVGDHRNVGVHGSLLRLAQRQGTTQQAFGFDDVSALREGDAQVHLQVCEAHVARRVRPLPGFEGALQELDGVGDLVGLEGTGAEL